MTHGLINANPVVHAKKERSLRLEDLHANPNDAVDALDIYDSVRDIRDPEHPYSLEQLSVLSEESVTVDDKLGRISPRDLNIALYNRTFVVDSPSHYYLCTMIYPFACIACVMKYPNQSRITFTPTVQHCSMAVVIGLCLRVKLMRSFPRHYKVDINVSPGSHAHEASVNKQLNDKERVAAALENPNLVQLVDECLESNDL